MADGTRVNELRKEVDSLKEYAARAEKNIEELRTMMTSMATNLQAHAHAATSSQIPIDVDNLQGENNQAASGYHIPTKCSTIEFPHFSGDNLRGWIYCCDQFFEVDETPPQSKVKIAAVHLDGRALQWHQAYMKGRITRDVPMWEEYVRALSARFGTREYEDPMAELVSLRKTHSVQQYLDRFDELHNSLELPDNYAMSCFLAGLKQEISGLVRMFKPQTLQDAVSLAKLQEQNLTFQAKSNNNFTYQRPNPKPNPNPLSPKPVNHHNPSQISPHNTSPVKPNYSQFTKTPNTPILPSKRLSSQDFDEKRAKGLCFWYDEKFTKGHDCRKKRQLYFMQLPDEEEEESEYEDSQETCENEEVEVFIPSQPVQSHLTLHVMMGIHTFKTMRITGSAFGKPLHVLIDCGSTHNFLDFDYARKAGCKLEETTPFHVDLAGNKRQISQYECKKFTWRMQGVQFQTDIMILPFGGCDMVLGIQWLVTLGDIMWNFSDLKMVIPNGNKKVVLRGTQPNPVKLVTNKQAHKMLQKPSDIALTCMGSVTPMNQTCEEEQFTSRPSLLSLEAQPFKPGNDLLQNFQDLFEEPQQLPPPRTHDHAIVLKEGTDAINVRPYRYPAIQKNEIEKIIQEMLDTGVVRESISPFSSPIILVKKKDGTWRLCVDYRELNRHTIKDKFPIPVIEELLDELYGATIFSKLDLRSGYHQIRMKEGDISKTAFRTHQGHYEFLVIPFGLTNAPSDESNFPALSQKIHIVFFYDILVYSTTTEDHLHHLKLTFEVLRQHKLFLKKSKCQLFSASIEYLGHIISKEGVAADPAKTQAMTDWHIPRNLKRLRGFLGVTGYYRRFIQGYGRIARPLTLLLKKNNFHWNTEAEKAFNQLKQAMMQAPVLALPNFSQQFIIETDASGGGIGAVLMKQGQPIAFMSKVLTTQHQALSVCEKELLALVIAIQKWRPYLIGRKFVVRTDHQSLKHLLEQRISTPAQQRWLTKLMGYDYTVTYKKGKENSAADALSRVPMEFTSNDSQLYAISVIHNTFMDRVKATYQADTHLQAKIQECIANPTATTTYQWNGEFLLRKGKVVVGKDSGLRWDILLHHHDGAIGGHSGTQATYKRIIQHMYWKGLKKDVYHHVQACLICQQHKGENVASPGLLQPIPIP